MLLWHMASQLMPTGIQFPADLTNMKQISRATILLEYTFLNICFNVTSHLYYLFFHKHIVFKILLIGLLWVQNILYEDFHFICFVIKIILIFLSNCFTFMLLLDFCPSQDLKSHLSLSCCLITTRFIYRLLHICIALISILKYFFEYLIGKLRIISRILWKILTFDFCFLFSLISTLFKFGNKCFFVLVIMPLNRFLFLILQKTNHLRWSTENPKLCRLIKILQWIILQNRRLNWKSWAWVPLEFTILLMDVASIGFINNLLIYISLFSTLPRELITTIFLFIVFAFVSAYAVPFWYSFVTRFGWYILKLDPLIWKRGWAISVIIWTRLLFNMPFWYFEFFAPHCQLL